MKNRIEEEYIGILSDLLHGGDVKEGRNGKTNHRWGRTLRHDMRDGFPLLTTKKVLYKLPFAELCWIIHGRTDLKYLQDNGVNYWNMNYEQSGRTDGTLGPVYGKQFRDFNGVDQFGEVLITLLTEPMSRRHLISLWNPNDLEEAALPCCWYSIQFNVVKIKGIKHIDILWNQRSADWFLGVPMDIAMMAALLTLVASYVDMIPRYVVGSFADTHLYHAHFDAAREQLSRTIDGTLPSLSLATPLDWDDDYKWTVKPSDLIIDGYNPQGFIKAPLL